MIVTTKLPDVLVSGKTARFLTATLIMPPCVRLSSALPLDLYHEEAEHQLQLFLVQSDAECTYDPRIARRPGRGVGVQGDSL